MAKRNSDKIKYIALAVLGGVLVIIFVYQIFFSAPKPKPRLNTQLGNTASTASAAKPTPAVPQTRNLSASAQQEALIQQLLSDVSPLNLSLISRASDRSDKPGARGNIFAYFVEPPPPPTPPPPPPPIQLQSVRPQGAVAGTPRAFTLVITGSQIPADAQLFFDGGLRTAKRVSDTQLSTEMTPADYAFARNINIDVKSQSEPAKLFSNPLQFSIQPAPEPQFIYKGRLGALNQPAYNYAVFELNNTKEIKRGKVGDTIMGVWRIDAISADAVDVTNTQYDIKKRIPLQDKVR